MTTFAISIITIKKQKSNEKNQKLFNWEFVIISICSVFNKRHLTSDNRRFYLSHITASVYSEAMEKTLPNGKHKIFKDVWLGNKK